MKNRSGRPPAAARRRGPAINAPCEHHSLFADVHVNRLEKKDNSGQVVGWSADVRVRCASCGLPFRFIGLPAGWHYAEPRVSVDGIELRAPIEPAKPERLATVEDYVLPPEHLH